MMCQAASCIDAVWAPAAGVAEKVAWLMQHQAKAGCVRDMVQLLVGAPSTSGSSGNGSASAAAAEGSAAGAALRASLGAASALVKALDAHKAEVFTAWQVGWARMHWRRQRASTCLLRAHAPAVHAVAG